MRLALIIAITITVAILSPAQQEAPSTVGAPTFVSIEGRFSISLPEQNGFIELTIPTPVGDAKGGIFQWQTKEATFGVGYADATQPLDNPETAKQFFNGATELFKKLAKANSGNVAPVRQITFDKYPGIEQRADLFTGAIIQRTYIVSRRIYEMVAVIKNSQRESESVAVGALDSFKLLSDAEVTQRRWEKVAKAEPSPLPQQPVAPRDGSDASDEGLRGRVKSVLTESQDLSGTKSAQGRKRDSFTTYNEHGNILRTEWYDDTGIVEHIKVYGFIDGRRVAVSRWIRLESPQSPMGGGIAIPPGWTPPIDKSDPRYQERYEFKYDEKKRLTERSTFRSSGILDYRYVYKYNENQMERSIYSADRLSMRLVFILDDKGNEVERTIFWRDEHPRSKDSFTYEFDSSGNWTKRTTLTVVTKDGGQQLEPYSVHYRTITYY